MQKAVNMRYSTELKTGWRFCLDRNDTGLKKSWYVKGLECFDEVVIPHTFSVEKTSDSYRGVFWYEYDFKVPAEWIGKRIWFYFHGIYRDAMLWVNGEEAGEHKGSGFTPFKLDATRLIHEGTNRLIVRGTNEFSPHALPWDRQFDWADDGGIFRPVELNVCAYSAVRSVTVSPSISIDEKGHREMTSSYVHASAVLWDDALQAPDSKARLEYELFFGADYSLKKIAQGSTGVNDDISFYVENARLWHFDHPYLYTLRIHLIENDSETDCFDTVFGFRSFTAENGKLFLNGEEVSLVGTEWMPGSDPRIGNAETREDIESWLRLLKGCNCVFTRVHWQQDDAFFDWCDRHGMLVQEEIPLWGQPKEPVTHESELAKRQADEMIDAHINHPSIIAWGVGNELNGQSPITKSYVEDMISYIKRKDADRLVTYVSNTLWRTPQDAAAAGDVIMANDYMGTWHGDKDPFVEIPRFWDEHRDKPLVISEFGLCEPAFAGGDKRREQIFLEKLDAYRRLGINGFIWFCLNDYRTQYGEEGEGRYRRRVHGSADIYGNPKPSYEAVKRECSPLKAESISQTADGWNIVIMASECLPRYTTAGYGLICRDAVGGIIAFYQLKTFSPGQSEAIHVDDPQERLVRIAITRPDGTEACGVDVREGRD